MDGACYQMPGTPSPHTGMTRSLVHAWLQVATQLLCSLTLNLQMMANNSVLAPKPDKSLVVTSLLATLESRAWICTCFNRFIPNDT